MNSILSTYIISLAYVLLMMVSLPALSLACSCIAPRAPLVELGESDFVFSGVVKDITPFSTEFGKTHVVKIQVLSKWKGEVYEEVFVQTADNSAACGYPFREGESYLIYGYLHNNIMQTGLCTRTNLLKNAQEDLDELAEGEYVSTYKPRCGGPTSAVVVQTFLFLFVGMAFSNKKRFLMRL